MFFNEHPYNDLSTEVDIPLIGKVSLYDAFSNTIRSATIKQQDNSTKLSLKLSSYESTIIVFGETGYEGVNTPSKNATELLEINSLWKLSLATATEYPKFTYKLELDKLINISSPQCFPRFSGTICYETEFTLDKDEDNVLLKLGRVYETAEVWINDQKIGVRVCAPYNFEVKEILKQGVNTLRIEVTNTLVREQRDMMSMGSPLEPSGLLGPVTLAL
jgi:hypothetical protein